MSVHETGHDLERFLRDAPLFSSIPEDQIRKIASLFTREKYQKDDVICRQGEHGDAMYIIRSGVVSIFKTLENQEVMTGDLRRGDFFGEIALLTDSPRNATVRVSLDAELYCLTRENFEFLIKDNKSIGLYLSRYYARQMTESTPDSREKINTPVFYAVSATGPGLGLSHFIYTMAYHIVTESQKKVLIIEPHLEPEQMMNSYGLERIACPDPGLYMLLPENTYRLRDINWFVHESDFYVLQLSTGFSESLSEVMPAMMEGLQQKFEIVFFSLSHEFSFMERLFARLCDRTLVLMNNTAGNLEQVRAHISELESVLGNSAFLGRIRAGVSHLCGEKGIERQKLKTLLNLPETPGIWVSRSEDAYNGRIDREKRFPVKGARAVAREIAGIRVGLALGAGAARGWAHIGVLKVLEEAGIHIDMISGTSMGGLVGGIYAAVGSVSELAGHTIDLFPTKAAARSRIFDYTIPLRGIFKGGKVEKLVRTAVNNADFLDLVIPAYIVGVDILNGEEVVFSTGDVTKAIRSSISIPAVFAPYQYNGRWMVDGGLLNPVPVDVLMRNGADMVIAVCIEPRDGGGRDKKRAPGIKGVVSRTMTIVHGRATADFARNADVVLYPDVGHFAWDDFHKGYELMGYGMEECMDRLGEIKEMVRTLQTGKTV